MNARITQLKEFLKEEPNDSFLIYALSLEYVKESNLELAIQTLLDLNQKDENYLAVYYQLGKLLQSMNEIEKATTFFDKGMEIAKKKRE